MTVARDYQRQALEHPDAFERDLDGYYSLLGGERQESTDIRIGSIPQTRHLDRRRYTLGLDRITAHMRPLRSGELVTVGAREGYGKTSFGELIALANAPHHRVLFTSLEMTSEEIRDRCLAKIMRRSVDEALAHREDDSEEYCEAMIELKGLDLMIRHPQAKKDRTIQAITQYALDVNAAIHIIDYSRIITGWKPGDAAAEVMDYLAAFVRQRFVTTVLLAQLNREAALRRPHTGNFQDTGRLEQAADRAILLWRPYLGNPKKDHVAEIIVAKNRQGPAFRAHASWLGHTMTFHDMTAEADALQPCCSKQRKETD